MRNTLLPSLAICLILNGGLVAAEPPAPGAAPKPGIFGEFTLASGERVIGLYHPEQGTIEVYGPAKVRAVKPSEVVFRRRLAPEAEPEPTSLDAGRARVSTLGSLISNAQSDIKRIEHQRSELEKARHSKLLERSKRDEGNKGAEEMLLMEKDPERKVIFAALATEHLKGVAAANAAIVDLDVALVAIDARFKAAVAECDDLTARMDWLQGRLAPMERESEEKKRRK